MAILEQRSGFNSQDFYNSTVLRAESFYFEGKKHLVHIKIKIVQQFPFFCYTDEGTFGGAKSHLKGVYVHKTPGQNLGTTHLI